MLTTKKHSGGRNSHRPSDFILAGECEKYFNQISLRKLTFKELFNLFGVIVIAENKFYTKLDNYLVFVDFNPHWLCGAHQKVGLALWLFMLQYYYKKKLIINCFSKLTDLV